MTDKKETRDLVLEQWPLLLYLDETFLNKFLHRVTTNYATVT
jgi:hypothetical protein